jgi:hypothetical protein
MPPLEPGQPDDREEMRTARMLLATVGEEGNYLYRLDDRGGPAGDTWHPTLAEVKEQAQLEYEVGPNDWVTIPGDKSDFIAAVDYVRGLLTRM